jgi:DNA-binding NarL/FixJ family response regulator
MYSALKILVVDDLTSVVEEVSEFLQGSGYLCVPCTSSREALEHFRDDTSIGIVLCDLDMPELNGIELMNELKLIAGKKRLFEAIMLTGYADKQDVIKALRAGIADYYQKPVNLNELLEGIQRQEAALQERHKSFQQLGHLNEKLQYLAASIDDLYHDLDKTRRQQAPVLEAESHAAKPSTSPISASPIVEMSDLFAPLSPRQLDVARLVAKGQTNYQIACELGITENTVKLYVSQVLRLTHMHNRTQLALALSPNHAGRQKLTTH